MSSTLTFLSRLASTPMTSLLRGRLAPSKRQLRDQLLASGLPEPTRQLIGTVVKRTKLWLIERADVQAELIAHFRDGVDTGATPDDLVNKFGDAEATAKLIRRAKIRNRPIAWHVKRFAIRAVLVLVVVYGLLFARFWFGRPTVSVNYVAQLNAPLAAVPESERAWPIYREVIRELVKQERIRSKAAATQPGDADWSKVLESRPGDANFAKLVDHVAKSRTLIEQIGIASRKRELGFVFGLGGSNDEPGNPWGNAPMSGSAGLIGFSEEENRLAGESMFAVLLPYLSHGREMSQLLESDAVVASSERDGARFARRIEDVLGVGRQFRQGPFFVCQLVGIGIEVRAVECLSNQLAIDPSLLSDEQLIRIAHAMPKGRVAADVFDLSGEWLGFRDMVQRVYTDDGNGDGRLTSFGLRVWRVFAQSRVDYEPKLLALAPIPRAIASRREVLEEFDRLTRLIEADMATPLRATPKPSRFRERFDQLIHDGELGSRQFLILTLLANYSGSQRVAERFFARRDAALIVIACELHKRRTGSYPATLDDLRPLLLPEVPLDPFDGKPLRYAIRDGKPFVYSVGADGDDDGGRLARKTRETPSASNDGAGNFGNNGIDADWILFPEPSDAEPASDRDEAVSTTQASPTTRPVER
jgi:hypothetical protein